MDVPTSRSRPTEPIRRRKKVDTYRLTLGTNHLLAPNRGVWKPYSASQCSSWCSSSCPIRMPSGSLWLGSLAVGAAATRGRPPAVRRQGPSRVQERRAPGDGVPSGPCQPGARRPFVRRPDSSEDAAQAAFASCRGSRCACSPRAQSRREARSHLWGRPPGRNRRRCTEAC